MYFKLLLFKLGRQFKICKHMYFRESQNHKRIAAFLSTQLLFRKCLPFVRLILAAEWRHRSEQDDLSPCCCRAHMTGVGGRTNIQVDEEEFQLLRKLGWGWGILREKPWGGDWSDLNEMI